MTKSINAMNNMKKALLFLFLIFFIPNIFALSTGIIGINTVTYYNVTNISVTNITGISTIQSPNSTLIIQNGTLTNITVNQTAVQYRVNETCASGSSIRVINADGTVICETDSSGTGTVTSIATGFGLYGGTITNSGTLYANLTELVSNFGNWSEDKPNYFTFSQLFMWGNGLNNLSLSDISSNIGNYSQDKDAIYANITSKGTGNVTGSGVSGNLSYWTSSGNINSSAMFYNTTTGYVGLNKNYLSSVLDIAGNISIYGIQKPNRSSNTPDNTQYILFVKGAKGTNTTSSTSLATGGVGQRISLTAGDGGDSSNSSSNSRGGAGGQITIQSGAGGNGIYNGSATNTGGAGGEISFVAGNGATPLNGNRTNIGGQGGGITFTTGTSGASGSNNKEGDGVQGGDITFLTGNGGDSYNGSSGSGGRIFLTGGNGGLTQSGLGKVGGLISLTGGTGGRSVNYTGGDGGYVSIIGGQGAQLSVTNGSGGSVFIAGGLAGLGATNGNIFLGVNPTLQKRGNVSVGYNLSSINVTLRVGGEIQSDNYYSADGTLGATLNCEYANVTVKNGLVTGCINGTPSTGGGITSLSSGFGISATSNPITTTGTISANLTELVSNFGNWSADMANYVTFTNLFNWGAGLNNLSLIQISNNVGNYSQDRSDIYQNITNLQTSNASSWTQINGAYTNITNLQTSNNTLFSRFDALYFNVSNLFVSNTSIWNWLTTNYNNVTSINSTLNQRINDLNTSKAGTGTATCATGTVAQNVTLSTSGVTIECVSQSAGGGITSLQVNGSGLLGGTITTTGSIALNDSYIDSIIARPQSDLYKQRYDFESTTAGYTNLWIPTAISSGTAPVLTAFDWNHPGLVNITVSSGTAGSGYAFQQSNAGAFRLTNGSYFYAVIFPQCQASSLNISEIRVGYQDGFTSARPVDGLYFNLSLNTSGATGTWNVTAMAVNNSVALQSTVFGVTCNNWYSLQGVVYGPNNAYMSLFDVNRNVLQQWNLSYRVPTEAGRETSSAIVAYTNGARYTTLGHTVLDYFEIGVNQTIVR